MKYFVITFSMLMLICPVFAEVEVNGIVTEANTNPSSGIVKKPIARVEVIDTSAVATNYSADDGSFRMVYKKKKFGEKVSIKFSKKGYEVFNSELYDSLIIPEDRGFIYPVKLCPMGTMARLFQERRDNQLQILNQKYLQEKKKLDATRLENARYNEQLRELQEKLEANQKLIDQYARQFAVIDFDDACELYRKAYILYEKGELDSVNVVLGNVSKIADDIMVENQKTNLTKKQTEELLRLAARNYILNGFDYENATMVYKKLLALDSANVENLVEYAQFIESRDRNGEAIEYYSKASKISSNDYVKARILNKLGNLKNKQSYPLKDVSGTYLHALGLILKHDSLGITENRDAISVFLNVANYQKEMHRYSDAEKNYILGINSIRNIMELYNDNRDRLLMATYLTNLGCLRTDMRKFDLAEENLVDALNIFRKEPANDSLFYQADFINNLNCIGRLNLLQKKTDSAEPYFIEALSRSRACMKLDSLKYLSTLCTSLDNLGMCKAQMNDFENAERYCNEALSLANKRKETHSKTNDFLLSVILFDEATMKVIKGERELAVQYFSRSLNIRRELAQDKPETYTVSIIEGLNALSKVYIQNNEYDRAEGTLLESLCLCYKLKYEWINEYDIEIFETYRVLSDLAVKCGDVKEVNIYSNEALAYCSLLQKKDLKGFEPEKNRIVKELESVSKNKKKQEKTEKLTRDDSVDYSEWMGTLSYFLILERKFNEAEYFATKALILSPAKIWIKTNLALSLLLQGKLKEAQPIYIELKDKTYPPEKNKKFKEIFLQDLDEIEAEGIYQSDITKIRSILVE